eukprot:COSAG04_NODE_6409_length_1333_cov_1.662885_1_plen_80_part_00
MAVLGAAANSTSALINRYTGMPQGVHPGSVVTLLAGISARAARDGGSAVFAENDTSVAAGADTVVVVVRSEIESESHDR